VGTFMGISHLIILLEPYYPEIVEPALFFYYIDWRKPTKMNLLKAIARFWKRYWIFILGAVSVVWFIIRVIPKPSRAAYPCQRAAFPLASAFVIWITGSLLTYKSISLARNYLRKSHVVMALGMSIVGVFLFTISYVLYPAGNLQALGLTGSKVVPELIKEYDVNQDQFIEPVATVSIVKSDQEDVQSITKADVEAMVREAVDLAGGLGDLVSDGHSVVLKPNIVLSNFLGSEISPEANGMVTDWRVVAAVAKIVRELNPSGKILVMEGSAGASTSLGYELLHYTQEYIPEVDEFIALEEVSGEWQNREAEELVSVLIPGETALYPDFKLPNGAAPYYYNRRYYQADLIISLPVLKNHETAGVTGAVKNMGIGGTPANIYGNGSDQFGRWNTISHREADLQKFIHDFYYGCPAHFAVMDGIQGYSNGPNTNFGPSNIEGHQEQMGLILASKDPVAMDAIESLIMFDDPGRISHLVYLDNSNVGCADPMAIEVKGELVSEVKKKFPHESKIIDCDYTDENPPGAQVGHVEYGNNTLTFSMSDISEIGRLNIELDGQIYPQMIISQFDDVQIDLSGYTLTDSMLTIYSHDEYMNTEVFEIKGNRNVVSVQTGKVREKSLSVYPNPARQQLGIRFNSSYTGDLSLSLYNLNGQVIRTRISTKIATAFFDEMELSGIDPGNYILVIGAGNQRHSVAVIVE